MHHRHPEAIEEQGLGDLLGSQYVQETAKGVLQGHMKGMSWLSWDAFRYYFHVDNNFVLQKVKLVALPCFRKKWRREERSDTPTGFAYPTDDVCAPDLYIPSMAYITYAILMGYIQGTFGTFDPDVLGVTMTRAFITLFLEIGVLLFSLYLLGAPSTPPILDCLAFCSYKFVLVNAALLIWLLCGRLNSVFYIAALFLSTSAGMFMTRTLQRLFPVEGRGSQHRRRKDMFLICVGLLQFPLVLYLCRVS